MTEAEELELLELEEMEAQAASPVPPVAPVVAKTDPVSKLRAGLQGFYGGFSDELGGGIETALKGDFTAEGYRRERDALRAEQEAAANDNPGSTVAGGLAGAVVGGGLARGVTAAPRAVSGLARLGRTIKAGAVGGAISGAGESDADFTQGDVAGVARDSLRGAGIGGVLGGGLSAAGGVIRGVGRGLKRLARPVTPTLAASELMGRGVNLTTGQMNPESALNAIEEANTSVFGFGQGIKGQREAALKQARDLVAQEAAPEGSRLSPNASTMAERMEELRGLYKDAYGRVMGQADDNQQISGLLEDAQLVATTDDLAATFRGITGRRGAGATAAERQAADGFLQDLATRSDGPEVTPRELQAMRSKLREKIRGLEPTSDRRGLYKEAERAITNRLEESLPEAAQKELRGLDARYGNLKTLEKAVVKAGDRGEGAFSPFELSQAIKSTTDGSKYARGLGRLRELSQPMSEVFKQVSPATGQRALAVVGTSPGIRIPVAGMSYLANTAPGQRLMLGDTLLQRYGFGPSGEALRRARPELFTYPLTQQALEE